MNKPVRLEGVGIPSANYELAVASAAGPDGVLRQLHTSGIGPVRADGTVPDNIVQQADVVWSTLLALLEEAEMAVSDVVQVTTFVVDPGPDIGGDGLQSRLQVAMTARDTALGSHRCASVLVPVPALATASWSLEVAVVAVGTN